MNREIYKKKIILKMKEIKGWSMICEPREYINIFIMSTCLPVVIDVNPKQTSSPLQISMHNAYI